LADSEERRASGGALISGARLATLGVQVADPTALDEALRPGGTPRPVWIRALAVAASIDDPGPADLVTSLLLCAAGTTARLRYLLFAGVPTTERAEAIAAWREGSLDPWARIALGAAAQTARGLRLAVVRAIAEGATEDTRLDSLGRAAISARRALQLLRDELATTVPALAERLALSRPAAGDALERLSAVGVATEITGRARDRVFALTGAWEVVRE
jgi:hypothetical protein